MELLGFVGVLADADIILVITLTRNLSNSVRLGLLQLVRLVLSRLKLVKRLALGNGFFKGRADGVLAAAYRRGLSFYFVKAH